MTTLCEFNFDETRYDVFINSAVRLIVKTRSSQVKCECLISLFKELFRNRYAELVRRNACLPAGRLASDLWGQTLDGGKAALQRSEANQIRGDGDNDEPKKSAAHADRFYLCFQ